MRGSRRGLSIVAVVAASSGLSADARGDVTFLNNWGSFSGSVTTIPNTFNSARSAEVDATGRVYVTDISRGSLQVFSPDGNFLTTVGSPQTAGGGLESPWGVAFGPAGDIYVSDNMRDSIAAFNNSGTFTAHIGSNGSGAGQFLAPTGIGVNSAGTIFAVDAGLLRVESFKPDGTPLSGFSLSGSGVFPAGLAVSPLDGRIYVANQSNPSPASVQIYSGAGSLLGMIGSPGTGTGQFTQPSDIAVSANGRVYVADGAGRVEVFGPDGSYLTTFGSLGSGPGQFMSPSGVSVGPNGLVYVADQTNARVARFFDPDAWISGTNTFTNPQTGPTSVAAGTGQLLGQALNIDASKGLVVSAATSVLAGGSLILSGGTINTGSFVVSGAGAQFQYTGGTLTTGSVSVSSGGIFDANHGNVVTMGGAISVSGAGSQFIVEQSATLAAASLNNGAGGLVALNTSGLLTLNQDSVNSGSINLAGGALTVHGALTNQAGGSIQGVGNVTANNGISNAGTIGFAGASNVMGNINNTAAGTIRLSGIQPNVFFNNVTNDGTITIDAGSGATFYGTFSGTHGIGGAGTAFLDGPVSPGHSPAAISFGGAVSFGSGSSQLIELGGLTRGIQYDAIDITGAASLAGMMVVSAINAFTPLPGQTFQVMTFGSRSGDVSVINETAYAGLRFSKSYTSTSLTLSASGLAGDANLDGVVNSLDFTALAAHFSTSGQNWLAGDFNGDGVVNALDFNALATNFGHAMSAPSLETLIPEPATPFVLLSVAAAIWYRKRQRS